MNLDLDIFSASSLIVVPIIVAICQAIKLVLPDRLYKWMPFFSIGIGIIISFLSNHNSADLTHIILSGMLFGLTASGLYSGVKSTMEAQKMQSRNKQQNNDNNNC
jgi:L-cystine uptake protein TcyP (sodium:dicarboxylate symporter family)